MKRSLVVFVAACLIPVALAAQAVTGTILGLVTVVSITALSALGGSITALLQAVTSALNTVI